MPANALDQPPRRPHSGSAWPSTAEITATPATPVASTSVTLRVRDAADREHRDPHPLHHLGERRHTAARLTRMRRRCEHVAERHDIDAERLGLDRLRHGMHRHADPGELPERRRLVQPDAPAGCSQRTPNVPATFASIAHHEPVAIPVAHPIFHAWITALIPAASSRSRIESTPAASTDRSTGRLLSTGRNRPVPPGRETALPCVRPATTTITAPRIRKRGEKAPALLAAPSSAGPNRIRFRGCNLSPSRGTPGAICRAESYQTPRLAGYSGAPRVDLAHRPAWKDAHP